MSAIGQQLIDIVRAKAAENPDFRYEPPGGAGTPCVYVHRGKPSCLIGHALWGVGLIDADFSRRQERTDKSRAILLNAEGFDLVAPELGLELDREERMWLEQVQAEQDKEKPWGIAVKAADDFVKDLDE
jgi:hypothetical protein